MSTARITEDRPWTVEEFDRWNASRPQETEVIDGVEYRVKYEFVDGFPLRMMAGASKAHNRVQSNVGGTLFAQLLDMPCEPFGSDYAVETLPGQRRQPDYIVECDGDDDEEYATTRARLVMEVLSPSTRAFDHGRKLVEYQNMPSLAYILLVDPTRIDVRLWRRSENDRWFETEFTSLDETVDLSAIGATLPVAAIYRRVEFLPSEDRAPSV